MTSVIYPTSEIESYIVLQSLQRQKAQCKPFILYSHHRHTLNDDEISEKQKKHAIESFFLLWMRTLESVPSSLARLIALPETSVQ